MQLPPLQAGVKAATARFVGPASVEFAEVAKSTWNFQRFSELVPKLRKKLGDPAGGGVAPSRSEGKRLSMLEFNWKHCAVAASPASICARSNAHTPAPT